MPDATLSAIDKTVSDYLDRVMAAARLTPRDSKRVRGELESHLLALLETGQSQNLSEEETWIMVQKEFGEPERLGKEIAHAKGRFLTWLKRESRKFVLSLLLVIPLTFAVKAYAINIYQVATDAAEPYALKNSRVLVNRLAGSYRPGDVVLFNTEFEPAASKQERAKPVRVGIVKSVQPDKNLVVSRNGSPDVVITKNQLIGRVFLETR